MSRRHYGVPVTKPRPTYSQGTRAAAFSKGCRDSGLDLPSRNKTVDLDREHAHLARGDDAVGHPLSIQAGHA